MKKIRIGICILLIIVLSNLNVFAATSVSYWYSDANRVSYVADASYHIYNLSSDSTFNSKVNSAVSYAAEKWSSVLPVSIFSASVNYAINDIYSGTKTQLIELFPMLTDNMNGVTRNDSTYKADVKYNGVTKKVYKISSGSKMAIVKRSDGTLAKYKNTATHEMGHLLGWVGHSSKSTDIMYAQENGITTLTTRDKNHIKQIYNLFY